METLCKVNDRNYYVHVLQVSAGRIQHVECTHKTIFFKMFKDMQLSGVARGQLPPGAKREKFLKI